MRAGISASIGRFYTTPAVITAPMAGITDPSLRLIVRECGFDGLAFPEMVNAKGISMEIPAVIRDATLTPEDHPAGVQIFGSSPDDFLSALKVITRINSHNPPVLIDINAGCPVRKIVKTGSGAYLMRKPEILEKTVKKLVEVLPVPVSVKMRLGWEKKGLNFLDVAYRVVNAGADFVVIHARTVEQMYSGKADWNKIKEAVKVMGSDFVVGNGDVFSVEDALRMIDETGAGGVMIARGMLGNPFLPADILSAFKGKPSPERTPTEKLQALVKHARLFEKLSSKRFEAFRRIAVFYIKSIPDASHLRAELVKVKSSGEVERIVQKYIKTHPEVKNAR